MKAIQELINHWRDTLQTSRPFINRPTIDYIERTIDLLSALNHIENEGKIDLNKYTLHSYTKP